MEKEDGDGVRESPSPFAREEARRGDLTLLGFEPCALVLF
jgi:hypothetical protein